MLLAQANQGARSHQSKIWGMIQLGPTKQPMNLLLRAMTCNARRVIVLDTAAKATGEPGTAEAADAESDGAAAASSSG